MVTPQQELEVLEKFKALQDREDGYLSSGMLLPIGYANDCIAIWQDCQKELRSLKSRGTVKPRVSRVAVKKKASISGFGGIR